MKHHNVEPLVVGQDMSLNVLPEGSLDLQFAPLSKLSTTPSALHLSRTQRFRPLSGSDSKSSALLYPAQRPREGVLCIAEKLGVLGSIVHHDMAAAFVPAMAVDKLCELQEKGTLQSHAQAHGPRRVLRSGQSRPAVS